MVTAGTCPAVNFDMQKRSLPFIVDDDVVNLIDSILIRGSPTQFVDISVGEDGSTNYASVAMTKFSKPLSVIVNGSTAVPPHCILSPGVIIPTLSIQIFRYQ